MVIYRKVYDLDDCEKGEYDLKRFIQIFKSMREPLILVDDTLEDNKCRLILQNSLGIVRYELLGDCDDVYNILTSIEDELFFGFKVK